MTSKTAELFGNATDAADLASRWDAFQQAMIDAPNTSKGDRVLAPAPGGGQMLTKAEAPAAAMGRLLGNADISKALGADTIASITQQLEQVNAQKDFTLTSPLNTGYVAYDLEAPAKLLYPKPTPLRNKIARGKGVGTAHQFKSIDGISGSAGGPGVLRPGITDSTTTSFGGLSLNRGAKIQYAGSEKTVPYLQFGLSSSVPFSAQFSGEGFMDARATDQASVLYASMLSEERLLLGGRGTAAGFQGALSAPAAPTLAARSASGSEVGLAGVTTDVYVKVTAVSVFGESVLSSATTVAASNGQVVDVTIADVTGALGYNVYASTGASDPGDGSRYYAATGGSNLITLQGALPTSGKKASDVAADTSASALDYDGILTVCASTASGYRKRLNAAFSTTAPGSEFQAAFAAMYDVNSGGNLADPDEVLLNGLDRKQLSEALRQASSSNYRITIANDGSGNSLGNLVTGLVNEVTGKMVDLSVHPYLPQGNAPILSHTLPFPDSNVEQCWAVKNVQDYLAFQWPVIQNSYDTSSYWYGTFFCYAPKWQGFIGGIKKA